MIAENVVLTLEIFQNEDHDCRIQFAAYDGTLTIRLIDHNDVCVGKGHVETQAEIKAVSDFLQLCYFQL